MTNTNTTTTPDARRAIIRRHLIETSIEKADFWHSAAEIAEATGLTSRQVGAALKVVDGFPPAWVEVDKDTRESAGGMSNFTGGVSIVNVYRVTRSELLNEIRRARGTF